MSINSDLNTLQMGTNKYLKPVLAFIIQPEYRKKNKARALVDLLINLNTPLMRVLQDPGQVHDTAIDDAIQDQRAVIDQLSKDYPDHQQDLEEAYAVLEKVYGVVKTLRQEVGSAKPPKASPSQTA